MPAAFLVVPYARSESDATVLLAQTQLVQSWAGGQRVAARIPGHAGQWVLVRGKVPDGESVTPAAFKLFKARTGIDLGDPQVLSTYGLAAPQEVVLQDRNYTQFTVLYLSGTVTGLEALAAAINANISATSVVDGVFVETAATDRAVISEIALANAMTIRAWNNPEPPTT